MDEDLLEEPPDSDTRLQQATGPKVKGKGKVFPVLFLYLKS